ncbi:leukocyte receptor cluster member 1 [Latimeria chalumnae]|uniref:leukocyte receptor cluster member 1 n=1 Tax=Latimeria chalumnae TaxID=7897 RepID=UPI0006D8F29C|nr:PREDICTED: leukocyte receptor cluster member 1 [Latimeria chalumnae]|eukprot:XP_014346672.1 PREDICTED: leukocyte receptor cluster member 1 [Latimeria chalumnae]
MNILPKKSWHVRNKDNVARVRRDEAQAAEEERERKRRVELAEQEARTDYLRKKARLLLPTSSCESSTLVEVPKEDGGHLNFFQDLEEGKKTKTGNREHEEEKKREKEKQERAIGLLTYLGQSAAEAQTSKPWYQEVPARSRADAEDATRHEKLKASMDPLKEMEKYMRKKKGEEKKKHRHKEKMKERKMVESSSAGKPSMEQLRAERLKREKAERARTEVVLARARGDALRDREDDHEPDDRNRRYNSQFNPELARRPRKQEWKTY